MADNPADVDPRLLEILVCPLTKASLRYDRAAQELVSVEAGLAYPIRDGIPIMLVDEARALDDGKRFRLPAEYLRVESPSAEVQGHGPGQKQLVHGRARVGMIGVEAVGNYAVRIKFDDLHDTGIYTWRYLYQLGEEQERRWADYLGALAKAGLAREPKRG